MRSDPNELQEFQKLNRISGKGESPAGENKLADSNLIDSLYTYISISIGDSTIFAQVQCFIAYLIIYLHLFDGILKV